MALIQGRDIENGFFIEVNMTTDVLLLYLSYNNMILNFYPYKDQEEMPQI